MQIENLVKTYITRHRLLDKGKRYLLALSGGADSVALLCLLTSMKYEIEAIHCNFKLRAEESDRDENFCKSLCKKFSVPLHIAHFDTTFYASSHKVSIEMAARELRYGYFENLRKDLGMAGICVAHHNDDNVETVLINLIRGTGIHGLTGMAAKNGHILRPLLCLTRQNIVDYLQQQGQEYVTDSTNLVNDVVRNKLRLDIIPLLQKVNPSAINNISRTIARLNEAAKILDAAIGCDIKRIVQYENKRGQTCISISTDGLQQTASPEYTLYYIIKEFGFSPLQIEQIAANAGAKTGNRWVSKTHTLVSDRNKLLVEPTLPEAELDRMMKIPETGSYVFTEQEKFIVTSGTIDLSFSVSKSAYLIHLDMQKVVFPLTVRHVRKGDRFMPFGMRSSKLVSDYLTDKKRSFFDKQRQLVVTDAHGDILWLVGERPDNRFCITQQSKHYLSIAVSFGS